MGPQVTCLIAPRPSSLESPAYFYPPLARVLHNCSPQVSFSYSQKVVLYLHSTSFIPNLISSTFMTLSWAAERHTLNPPTMRASRWSLLLAVLFLSAVCRQASCQRLILTHDVSQTRAILKQAQQHGLKVLGSADGFLVLSEASQEAGSRTAPVGVKQTISKIKQWPGVQHVEEDKPRFLQRALLDSARAVKTQQSGGSMECSSKDKAVSNSLLPEYMPYGISQIQADSSKLPSSIDKSGVMVCIIDSGVDASHPDLKGNQLDGCKFEDSFAPGGCPFQWTEDYISHGTHVAGTIAAKRDNQGLIGVVPDGAELYVVRVFNDSGDVNQGQGLVYGSTLILAFTQCEGRLAAMQARFPERQYRMVVSMSLGAPGPLTIEQLFFREAVKRGDILFVGSSGNNGSSPILKDGKLTSSLNPGNFPGTYPEVISVAAVDCNNRLAPFSQKHPSVDIAAPGVDILSTASRQLSTKAGAMKAAFRIDSGPKFQTVGGIGGTNSQIRWSGVGKVSAGVVDCGDGSKPCPEAAGNICLVQWDPKMKGGDSKSSSMRGRLLKWVNGIAGPKQGGSPAGIPQPAAFIGGGQQSMPTRFTCDLMEFCMKQGAKGALLAAPAPSSGYYPDWGWSKARTGEPEFVDWPFFANLRCTAYNCSCWERLKGQNILPAAGLTLKQYTDLKGHLKNNKGVKGTIESQPDLYQRLSGTSMAVPHVTGALARIWADFPNCKSDIVRKAMQETAKDLGPPGKDTMYGYGLLQAEDAYTWLSKQQCAQQPAFSSDERGQKQAVQQKQQQDQSKQQQDQQKQQSPPASSPKAGGQAGTQQAPRNLIGQLQPAVGSRLAFSDWQPINTRQ